jgi:hypothetical protein
MCSSDRACPHHAAGEGGIVCGYHYVQGVAAIGERGGDEAVVGGVADGTRQDPIAHDDPELGFVLVLVAAAYGDLYDGVEQPRSVFSDRQGFEVGLHSESGISRNLEDFLFSTLARSGSGGQASLWPSGRPPNCSRARR